MFIHVINAKYIANHRIHVWFNDGTDGEIDFANALSGPIFRPLTDEDYFKSFTIEGHTLAWPHGADFAPEYLHGLVESGTRV